MQAFYKKNQEFLVLTLIILTLAWFLRVYDLDGYSLWIDEGMEYWVATSNIHNLPQNVREGIQDPPLYSLLLHLWMKVGEQEFYLRFLSAIFSFLSVIGAMLLGYRAAGLVTALVIGSIMAILPAQIRYAQEVGQYALMSCLLTWNILMLQMSYRKTGRPKYLTVWTISAIMATYSYYGTALSVLIPFLIVTLESLTRRDIKDVKNRLLVLGFYVIGILPLLLYFLPVQLFRGPTANAFRWPDFNPLREEARIFLTATQHLLAFQFTYWPYTQISSQSSSVLIFLLLFVKNENAKKWRLWLLLTWATYYAISRLGLYPYGYRYSLILTPLLIPTISQGLSNVVRIRKWGISIFAYILVICILSLPNHALRNSLNFRNTSISYLEVEDLRPVVRYWMENHQETDVTYVYYGAAPVFRYYLHLFKQDDMYVPPTWYIHCWNGELYDYCYTNNIYYGAWIRQLNPTQKIHYVRNILSTKYQPVWLVFSHVCCEEDRVILTDLLKDHMVIAAYEQTHAGVYLLKPITRELIDEKKRFYESDFTESRCQPDRCP